MEVHSFNRKVYQFKKMWFVQNAFLVGGYSPITNQGDATLIILPKFGQDYIRFECNNCPITGNPNISGAVAEAENYFTLRRRLFWNIKTFFCYLKYKFVV